VDLPALPLLAALSLVTAGLGALGGLGGAVLLVPLLVLLGVDPLIAAPLGILSVAAGSLAAAPSQLEAGLVHHRLGISLEITASAGAIVGALVADAVPASVLARLLGAVALAAAIAGGTRKGQRNLPEPEFAADVAGEWPGTLQGAYRLGDDVIPYRARRVKLGLASMSIAGLVSGLAGVGGGFIKTPVMSELMHVPVKVAAATATLTVGITASTALIVFAGQDRIEYRAGAVVVVAGLLGGAIGARLQHRLAPSRVRGVLSIVLMIIGLVVLVRG
jgi:uncharacterized membrane protein YfcA